MLLFSPVSHCRKSRQQMKPKFHDVTYGLGMKYQIGISKYLGKKTPMMKIGFKLGIKKLIIFPQKLCRKCGLGTSPRPIFIFIKLLIK